MTDVCEMFFLAPTRKMDRESLSELFEILLKKGWLFTEKSKPIFGMKPPGIERGECIEDIIEDLTRNRRGGVSLCSGKTGTRLSVSCYFPDDESDVSGPIPEVSYELDRYAFWKGENPEENKTYLLFTDSFLDLVEATCELLQPLLAVGDTEFRFDWEDPESCQKVPPSPSEWISSVADRVADGKRLIPSRPREMEDRKLLYWMNFFGSDAVAVIGERRLRSLETYLNKPVGDGILIVLRRDPFHFTADHYEMPTYFSLLRAMLGRWIRRT